MVAIDSENNTKLLEDAFILTKNIKVHQDLCRQTIALALQKNAQFLVHHDWAAVVKELNNSVCEWSQLSALESFLKSDIISAQLGSLRARVADDQDPLAEHNVDISTISEAGSLIPPLLAIFRSPDAIEHLDALPIAHCDTAISLFQRIMSALPVDQAPLRDLVSSTLSHLQIRRRESGTGFDVPDLTTEIKLTSPEPVENSQLEHTLFGTWGENGLVTLKVIKSFAHLSPRGYKALQHDLKTRLGTQHPHLLPFYGTYSTQFGPALVSPYMSNGNAPSYLNSHPSANAISLLVGVADGLAHLHSCWPSIAHGDVRGSNILVSPSGDALLADHGLVKLIHRGMMEAPHDSGSHAQPTNSFANVESIRWAAPEIVCKQEDLEKNLSARQERTIIAPWSRDQIQLSTGHDALLEVVTTMSDVWSFAMTIYELLMGKPPYHQHARNQTVVLAIGLNELPLPPSSSAQVRSEWQPELWPLMQECWRMDRRKRPGMEAVSRKMRGILGKSLVMRESLALERTRSPTRSPRELSKSQSLADLVQSETSMTETTHSTPTSITRKISRSALSKLDTSVVASNNSPAVGSPISSSSSSLLHATIPVSFVSTSLSRENAAMSPTRSETTKNGFEKCLPLDHNKSFGDKVPANVTPENLSPEEAKNWDQKTLTQKRSFLYYRQLQQLPVSGPNENKSNSQNDSMSAIAHSISISPRPILQTEIIPLMSVDPSPITPTLSPTTSLPESAASYLTGSMYPPRSRTSTPQSVRSDTSRTTFGAADGHGSRDGSFDLIDEAEDQCTLTGHDQTADEQRSTFLVSTIDSIPPSDSTTDLMDEAFRSVSSLPTLHSGGHVPHDVSSPSSESLDASYPPPVPPRLERPQKKPDKSQSPAEFDECQRSLSFLLDEGTKYLKTAPESEVLVIIEEADITFLESYDAIRSAHEGLLDSLRLLTPLCDLGVIRRLFDIWEEAARTLPDIYQDYSDALSTLDGVLANVSEQNICKVLLQNEANHIQLSELLRGPYAQLELYSRTLADIFTALESLPSFHQILSFGQIFIEWRTFVSRACLWAWQSLAGTKPLIEFGKEEILFRNASDDDEGAARSESRFKIILNQKTICNQMHEAQKRFERIIIGDPIENALAKLCDRQGALLKLYVDALDELYLLQRSHHPSLPPITSIFLNAVERWEAAYTHHGRILEDIFRNQSLTNSMPFDKNLQAILQLPSSYIRNLLQDFKSLFDVTPDHHFDIELIIRLLPALEHLVDISTHTFWHNTVTKEVQNLRGMLSWGDIEPSVADLENPTRHLFHSGILYHPIDPNGARNSIDDRSTSVEVSVILLDNCLIVCDPQNRLGIRRLRVRVVIPLRDIHLPDLDAARASQQQIFLLDSTDGKKVAVPFNLRYRTARTPSILRVKERDGIDALFPNEVPLLATSTRECAAWRERLSIAKARLLEEAVKKPSQRSMFKLSPLARVSFLPTSSSVYFVGGRRKLILCSGGGHGGVFIEDEMSSTTNFLQSVDVRQCIVIESLKLALFLVGKALCSVKTDDLTAAQSPALNIIKNNVTFFRVGYQRGQLLLVAAYETSKSTLLKWYSPISRMSRRSMVFSPGIFSRSSKTFKSLGEHEILCRIHDLDILDDGIVTMGVSGFQLLIIDQGSRVKVEELPRLPVGASSAAAQRCQTSKALGVVRSGEETLLCYSDFGIYVNQRGEITGRPVDWVTPRIHKVAFGLPYLFLIAENHIEVRLVENCQKLEILEGNGFRLVRGIPDARLSSRARTATNHSDQLIAENDSHIMEEDSGLLHLAIPLLDQDSGFELMELQMEVLDLSA